MQIHLILTGLYETWMENEELSLTKMHAIMEMSFDK